MVRTPLNPSFYWGNFLLLPVAAGADLERWIGVFEAEFPQAGHIALGLDGIEGSLGELDPSAIPGLVPDIAEVMTADGLVGVGSPPAGVPVRALQSDDDWAQLLELRTVVGEEEGAFTSEHRRFLERRTEEGRGVCADGRAAFFGAFVDDRLRSTLGIFADGTGTARYQSVETHPGYRRRGLAAALVIGAAEYARSELGAQRLVMVADSDGPAIGLYRRLGFRSVEFQVQLQRAMTPSPESSPS